MFNVETAIAEWRRQMTVGGIKSSAVLDELESHLREDVEQRKRSGTPAEKAFEEAAQQIGKADALKLEFAKVTRPGPRLSYNFQRAACIAVAFFIVLVETWTLFEYEMTPTARLLGLAVVWASGIYIGLLPRLNRNCWHGVRGWEIRKALGFVGNFLTLWVVYLLLSTAKLVRMPPEIICVVIWSLVNMGWFTCLVLAYGFDVDSMDLWTSTAMQAFEAADAEALRFHHNFVGTEHVLLGLMGIENSSTSKVLERLGVHSETVRAEIEIIVGSGPKSDTSQALRPTPRAKKALALAIREAKAMRLNRVDTEHVFLGLLREGSGVAALVLKNLGVNVWDAREEILRTYRR